MLLIVLKKAHYVYFKDIHFFIFSIEVHLIYNVVLILCTSDSVIHIYMCIYIYIYMYIYIYIHTFFFNIHFHYSLSWDNEYSSLEDTVGPCCLPILSVTVCLCWDWIPSPSFPHSHPLGQNHQNHQSVHYVKTFSFFAYIGDTFWFFSVSICKICTFYGIDSL